MESKVEAMSAAEREAEILATRTDLKHPYNDGNSFQHQAAVTRMQELILAGGDRAIFDTSDNATMDRALADSRKHYQNIDVGLQFPKADFAHTEEFLREKWGGAYPERLEMARAYFQKHYSADDRKYLERLGRDNSSDFVISLYELATAEKKYPLRGEKEEG